MSSPAASRKGASSFAIGRRLAPHVDGTWAEAFVLELRLIGVAGDRIGAALSEVESHCADGGESASESFGDAAGYARSLDLPVSDDGSPGVVLRTVAPTAVQLVGMFIVSWSLVPMLDGEPLAITPGHVVDTLLGVLTVGLIVRLAEPMLRVIIRHPVRAALLLWVVLSVPVGAGFAALMLLDTPFWQVGAGWGLASGVAILAGGVAFAFAHIRSDDGLDDPITSPLGPLPMPPTRLGRLLQGRLLTNLIAMAHIPAGTVFLVVLILTLHHTLGPS